MRSKLLFYHLFFGTNFASQQKPEMQRWKKITQKTLANCSNESTELVERSTWNVRVLEVGKRVSVESLPTRRQIVSFCSWALLAIKRDSLESTQRCRFRLIEAWSTSRNRRMQLKWVCWLDNLFVFSFHIAIIYMLIS